MMQETYVSFEQAKLLEEKGFPQLGYKFKIYYGHTKNIEYCNDIPDCEINELLLWYCPTLSLVQKWLREEKNINIEIPNVDGRIAGGDEISYLLLLHYLKPIKQIYFDEHKLYNTYEEALSDGINKALELI